LLSCSMQRPYAAKLPKKEAGSAEWQAAIESRMLVAELDGPPMFGRIGIMKALNRGHVREFNPTRKKPHWGRRKLAQVSISRFRIRPQTQRRPTEATLLAPA
jgi:hypothetical protein